MSQKTFPKQQNQEIIYTKKKFPKTQANTGIIVPRDDYKNSTELKVSFAVVTVGKGNMMTILALNLNDHYVTIPKKKQQIFSSFRQKKRRFRCNWSGINSTQQTKMVTY